MLNDIGSAGTALAAWTMWTPKVALVPLTVGGLSYMANNLLCGEMNGPPDALPPELDGCVELENGYGLLESYVPGEGWGVRNGQTQITQIVGVGDLIQSSGVWGYDVTCIQPNGDRIDIPAFLSLNKDDAEAGKFRILPVTGTCVKTNNPDEPGNPDPGLPDYEYTDPETNCNYTLKLEGFVQQTQDAPAMPVWNIQSGGSVLRADGGVMGGCNLSPTIYMGGNGDGPGGPNGPPQIPVPPEVPGPGPDGVPWWLPPLISGATGAALNQIGNAINDLLETQLPEGSFTLTAPCNKDAEGNPLTETWTFPAQKYTERSLAHQITTLEALQTHLNWKTPTCDEAPIPEGDFRTISFRSDETSPYGKSRLRKRFRYRSVSGNDLGAVVDHWKDFVFEGGPYRVRWVGGTWGSPEVWAASEAEGKRVIQHAAAEAGFDPFESGRWTTRVTSSTRRRVQCTVRVDTTGGYYWITARDGSSERPTVALT